MPKKKKIMVVLGAGRSCTSGVARALHLGGWPMAVSEAELLPAHESNPWGHFEDHALVRLNDVFLARQQLTWDGPFDHPFKVRKADTAEATGYIDYRIAGHGGGRWGMKDPRLTWTWPTWAAAFESFPELEPILVTTYRTPQAAGASLVARDGTSQEHGEQLTRVYHDRTAALWTL